MFKLKLMGIAGILIRKWLKLDRLGDFIQISREFIQVNMRLAFQIEARFDAHKSAAAQRHQLHQERNSNGSRE
jgi:hypothetical protein